ncbi:MAG: ribosome biogenesis/translation initiation ATPase RLI [Candidatus Micrarchaeota archaeon]|nr:ribosome biogenesis/translation initiation ATPase RLI [Candidatus Micrarchaeota archaeon]
MPTRVAILDRELCIRERCPYQCIKVCPPNRMGDECIVVEESTQFPVIAESLCIGCGLCVKKCPMNCITIINLAGEEGKPIYQYGTNQFRLYNFPLPAEGVCGIVGKNGIGKTTALGILSRKFTPNFGEFKKHAWEEVISRLSISQRRYFEAAGEKQKVSMKVQNVEQIRKAAARSTVDSLLTKMDERGAKGDLVKKFGITPILKRKITQLSGGELQKVALAAALLKDADIYYLDEPSNYLDIEERLKSALILREFGEGRKLMVVEHDLAILDYMSDYVFIFYGEENAYGTSSGIKPVRNGINEYLSGFLKEENIKFREREIRLSGFSERERKGKVKVSYPELKKKLGDFSLSCEVGDIREGEIVGIVGKNAVGKTTFIKLLAGVEDPDEGQGLPSLKISYKPQYIEPQEGVTVDEMFSSEDIDSFISEKARRELGIIKLMEKPLTSLSGGELQRVSIAYALSQKADIFLFDEPTAFLDIEQRLRFSDLLRSVIGESEKSAFVVDHDVVFIDSIANRLIVFDGKSSIRGHASSPYDKIEGMNAFLSMANITMRRDKDSKRPRINKPDSVLDREQRSSRDFYAREN